MSALREISVNAVGRMDVLRLLKYRTSKCYSPFFLLKARGNTPDCCGRDSVVRFGPITKWSRLGFDTNWTAGASPRS